MKLVRRRFNRAIDRVLCQSIVGETCLRKLQVWLQDQDRDARGLVEGNTGEQQHNEVRSLHGGGAVPKMFMIDEKLQSEPGPQNLRASKSSTRTKNVTLVISISS